MTKFILPTFGENKRQINANDKSAIMTISAAIVLLGAFFVINGGGLTAFAAILDPDDQMVDKTVNGTGPVHPGELLVIDKNVTLSQNFGGLVNVTVMQFFEGTTIDCVDALGDLVLNVTTANGTTNIPEDGEFLLYNETFVGMPGTYHCDVIFRAVNITDSSISDVIGNQTIWIDAIGSKGFWKNHPDASDIHTPIDLGDHEVADSTEVTTIMKAHKGKFDTDKLAAQLLAAKLNQWALMNDTKIPCVLGNITDADQLLDDRGYGGVDIGTKFMKDQKRPALELHRDLDDFNNFGCP